MNRRRALLATTSIADNVFVIDDVYFEIGMWFKSEYYSYSSKIEELYNYVNQYFETNVPHDEPVDTSIYTEFNIPLDIYLYDYKLPIINWYVYETIDWREIYFTLDSTSPLPNGVCMLYYNEFRPFIGLMDGGWTFDHIPEPGMEAVMFVEFAKQMGLEAFEIDGYTVEWYEEGKSLLIINDNLFIDERIVYGAGNGMKSGTIHCGDYDGGISNYNYMTIYALEDGLQAKLIGNTISYSLDEGNTWTSLASDTYTPSVNSGEIIMFKGNLTPTSSIGIGTFSINKKCALMGNCNSLLFGDGANESNDLSSKKYAFRYLFRGCTSIEGVSKSFLPATKLATGLNSYCYSSMFSGCSSLTIAPELPATTLASGCYYMMFYGCSNLNYIKMLATDISASNCLKYWVDGVASSGTFVKNKNATWSATGVNGIPSGWTVQTA